jgi:hypothetical protein
MDLKNNPHYQNGVFKGSQMIDNIENTTYGTIENALESKKELVDDLKKNFGWEESHKDVAEALGMIAILEKELSIIVANQPTHQLTDMDVINTASDIGMEINTEQLKEIHKRYPQLQEDHFDTAWYLLVEHILNELKNENI